MFGLSTLMTRIAIGAILAILLLGFLQVRSCERERSAKFQHKVDAAQSGAFSNSAQEAIATQSEVNRNEVSAADQTRKNAEEIDNAKDADTRAPDAYAASLKALCSRPINRNRQRCLDLNKAKP
jgi:hypothetical protein